MFSHPFTVPNRFNSLVGHSIVDFGELACHASGANFLLITTRFVHGKSIKVRHTLIYSYVSGENIDHCIYSHDTIPLLLELVGQHHAGFITDQHNYSYSSLMHTTSI